MIYMLYSLTLSDGSSTFLVHYGIKGMRWGEWTEDTRRRYGHTTLKKGAIVSRYSRQSQFDNYKHDPLSGSMKYVSTNKVDHARWKQLFDRDHAIYGEPKVTSETLYEATNSLRVAKAKKAGKLYVDKVLPTLSPEAKSEVDWYFKSHVAPRLNRVGQNVTGFTVEQALDRKVVGKRTSQDVASMLASDSLRFLDVDGHNESSRKLMNELKKKGYSAVQDCIGWDTADDPLVIFDPKKNLRVAAEKKL